METSLEICKKPKRGEEEREGEKGPEKEKEETEVFSTLDINGWQVLLRELPESKVKDREEQASLVEEIKKAGEAKDWRKIFSQITELYCLQEMPDHANEIKGAETLIALYEAYKKKEEQTTKGEEISLELLTETKGLTEQLKQLAPFMREATLRLIIQICGLEIKPETEEIIKEEKERTEGERQLTEDDLDDSIEEEVPPTVYATTAAAIIATVEKKKTATEPIEVTDDLLDGISMFYRHNEDLQFLLYNFAEEPKHIGRPKTGENYLVLWVGYNPNQPNDVFVIKNQLIIHHLLKERYWHLQYQEMVDIENLPEEEKLAA